ncbi:glycoprotease family-domain-containing protein [Aspergillus crustosus]
MLSLRAASVHRRALWQSTRWITPPRRRGLLTLAIETSCDDTSVAIVEKNPKTGSAQIHFLENITADSTEYRGIHPLKALESHQQNLANLVNKSLRSLPPPPEQDDKTGAVTQNPSKYIHLDSGPRRKPDLISVTRGPGMRSNLFTGLDTAKALSVAWQIPFVGVHHMQAHLLTPRLVNAVTEHIASIPESKRRTWTESDPHSTEEFDVDTESIMSLTKNYALLGSKEPPSENMLPAEPTPQFPFLSLLVSGGHTLLVSSTGLTQHEILATTSDSALGEALDKVARMVLPESLISEAKTTMYGKMLESYAFPNGPLDYEDYAPPKSRAEEIESSKRETKFGWHLTVPYAQTRTLAFSFASMETAVKNILAKKEVTTDLDAMGGREKLISAVKRVTENPADSKQRREISHAEGSLLAREALRVCFEHLASRIVVALETLSPPSLPKPKFKSKFRTRSKDRSNLTYKPQHNPDIPRTLIISGGVAANRFLMKVLRSFLDARGFEQIDIVAPPPWLCTDNAAMIGWAGIEMYENGWRGAMDVIALKTWSLESPTSDDMLWGSRELHREFPVLEPGPEARVDSTDRGEMNVEASKTSPLESPQSADMQQSPTELPVLAPGSEAKSESTERGNQARKGRVRVRREGRAGGQSGDLWNALSGIGQ